MHGSLHGSWTPPAPSPMVVFENASRAFMARRGPNVLAVDDVSLCVQPGEIFGVIGRSGAGKSTLLRMINGLERPDSGRVLVRGLDVGALDETGLVALRRKVGMIFQGFNLLAARTVAENVALPLRLAGAKARDARVRALETLELVGLSDKANAYPARLSGGQKQRAGIARALVSNPDLLLSDEATSALDPESTQAILGLIGDVTRKLQLTTILITHEMEVIRAIADRVAVIDAGRIVEMGPVWQVFGQPVHEVTRKLVARRVESDSLAADARPEDVVFSIAFSGGEPDLFALAQTLGPGSRLVRGGVERLQGRAQGRLWIAANRTAIGDPAEALQRLRQIALEVEIVDEGARADVHQSV